MRCATDTSRGVCSGGRSLIRRVRLLPWYLRKNRQPSGLTRFRQPGSWTSRSRRGRITTLTPLRHIRPRRMPPKFRERSSPDGRMRRLARPVPPTPPVGNSMPPAKVCQDMRQGTGTRCSQRPVSLDMGSRCRTSRRRGSSVRGNLMLTSPHLIKRIRDSLNPRSLSSRGTPSLLRTPRNLAWR